MTRRRDLRRYCIHNWGPATRVDPPVWVTWRCNRCGEVRLIGGGEPLPGTFLAATEDFTNAMRNLGMEIRDALPGPIRRRLTP